MEIIKASLEVTVHAATYKKALALVEQIAMKYFDIDDLETLYQVVDIELRHKTDYEIGQLEDFIGFDVTAHIRVSKPYALDK